MNTGLLNNKKNFLNLGTKTEDKGNSGENTMFRNLSFKADGITKVSEAKTLWTCTVKISDTVSQKLQSEDKLLTATKFA